MPHQQTQIDIRLQDVKGFKITKNEDGDEIGTFEGYGNVYDVKDHHGHIVVKGAFAETVKRSPVVVMLWQHKTDEPIGLLNCQDKDYGLWVSGEINLSTQRGREAWALLKQKAINGLSIGGYIIEYDFDDEGNLLILAIDLDEVSIVTFAANQLAQVLTVKNADGLKPKPRVSDTGEVAVASLEKLQKRLTQSKHDGDTLGAAIRLQRRLEVLRGIDATQEM